MNLLHNKPVLIGGVAVLAIVIVLAAKGSASPGTQIAVANPGQSDAQIAAARDIQIAQLQAGVQASAANAQLAQIQTQGQIDLSKATLDAQLQKYAIDASDASDARNVAAMTAVQTLQIQAQTNSQDHLADIQAGIAKYTLDQALATTKSNNEFQLSYAQSANQTQVQLAALTTGLTENILNQQTTVDLAKIGATKDIAIAGVAQQINADNLTAQMQQQALAAQQSQWNSVISSLPELKKKNRDDVLKSLITGQYGYAGPGGPSNAAQIIGAVGGAAGNIAKLAGAIF